jgi:energy-coupling factor transporter ATP-binding protein EcfA2
VWAACDRVALMEGGRGIADTPVGDVDIDVLRRHGLRVPGLLDLEERLRRRGAWPIGALRAGSAGEAGGAGSEGRAESKDWQLVARGVSWTWPGASVPAVSGVSCEVLEGEQIAILGPNGSGKSTLMAALVGALSAKGVERRGRMVRVPQDPDLALFCETVAEELEYGPRENRLPRGEVTAAALEAAEALSVSELLDRAPHALSRGQRLRVAAAAAWSCSPDVLVLDEPTSGQDHDQVEALMQALTARGVTLIFATHDVDLALRHATRIWRLEAGVLKFDGPPTDPGAVDGLMLPPLVRWCLDRGLPPLTAAAAAARAGEG